MNKILVFVIVALLFTMAAQNKGCNNPSKKDDTLIVHDTTWKVHDSLIVKKLKVKETIHDTIPPEYIADTNYPKLKAQYDALVIAYLAKNIYTDTVKLDTLGYVAVADTVHKNEIHGRSYKYNYKIPTITNTVTINHYEKPKTKLFIGGGIDLSPSFAPTGAHGGLLLNTKKDQLIGLQVGTGVNGGINYGFSSYWKIKLK